MNNNIQDNNNISKDLTSQTHSTEPSLNILSKLNSIANENFHQIIPPIVCEICYKAENLIICEICKNGYHKKCLGTVFLPEPFICFHCKKQFTEDEISSIINNPYKQTFFQRKGIGMIENQSIYKEFEPKKKISLNTTIINPTKIIELDEDNDDLNDSDAGKGNDISQEKNISSFNNGINLNKKKNNKKILDINLVENMNEDNKDEICTKSENKPIKKDNKSKTKKEPDKKKMEGEGEEQKTISMKVV